MEVIIDKQNILAALNLLKVVSSVRSPANILQISTVEKGLQLSIFNPQHNLSCTIPAETTSTWGLGVDFKEFQATINILTEEDITLCQEENFLTCNKNMRIATVPAESLLNNNVFITEDIANITLDARQFYKNLNGVKHSVCVDVDRYHISVVKLEQNRNTFRLISTDGHRMAMAEWVDDSADSTAVQTTIPRDLIKCLLAMSKIKRGSAIKLSFSDADKIFCREIALKNGEMMQISLCSAYPVYEFPPYDQVIPQDYSFRVTCDKKELLIALKNMKAFTTKVRPGLMLSFRDDNLVIMQSRTECSAAIKVPLDLVRQKSDVDLTVMLNASYLIEAVKIVDSPRVTIDLLADLDPVVVRDAEHRYLTVIMPIRI